MQVVYLLINTVSVLQGSCGKSLKLLKAKVQKVEIPNLLDKIKNKIV